MQAVQETQVNGLDTIQDLVCSPPKEIPISYNLEEKQHTLQQGWNMAYIAIILYCVKCKAPLVWHTHPTGKVLFHCPGCGTNWVKGEGWDNHNNQGE